MGTFPHLFTLEWSQDHLRVIAKIEQVVRHRETLAVAMPCGSSHSAATELRDVGHQPKNRMTADTPARSARDAEGAA